MNDDVKPAPAIRPAAITRNLVWLTGGEFASRLIAFAIAIYLARVLGAEGFGALGAALALVSFLRMVVNTGLDNQAIRDAARQPERVPQIFAAIVGFRLLVALAAFGAILLILLLPGVSAAYRRELVLIYALLLFVDAFSTTWALRGLEKMNVAAAALVGQHLSLAAIIVAAVLVPPPDLRVFAAAMVVSTLLSQAGTYLYLARRFGIMAPAFSRAGLGASLKIALPLGLSKMARTVYYEGDAVLLGWLAGAASTGIFLASQKLIMSLAAVALIYQLTVFPTTSRLAATHPAAAARFQSNVLHFALIIVIPVSVACAVFAEPLIALLYGAAYADAAEVFLLMLFSLPVFCANMGMQNLLLATARLRANLACQTAIAFIHVALAVALVPVLGILGAAWGALAGEVAGLALFHLAVRRHYGSSAMQWRMLAPLVAGAGMAWLLHLTLAWPVWARLGAAAAFYPVAVLALGGLRSEELRFVWRQMRAFVPGGRSKDCAA